MKLEVGMYIRNKEGYILLLGEENITGYKSYIGGSEITKASHNIIDLIEVGDYVNGQLVYEYLKGTKIYLDGGDYGEILILEDGTPYRPIKSIVTKEQFENMSYKVEE